MKPFTAIVSVFLAYTIVSSHAASLNRVRRQVVPREFANINIENYLKNDRAVAFQLKCIVYDGPCDRIGKYLKVTIPELLTNQCQNCDPAQRQRAGRLVQHIQQKYPKEWSDAVQKFQGGPVKKEDADKLESLLGVKLDSKLVAEATSTVAPVPVEVSSSTTAAPVAVSSTPAAAAPVPVAPESSTAAAPAVVPVAEVSSTSAPVVASSTEAVVAVSSTAAPAVSSSESPVAAPTSAVPLVSSSEAPVVVSSEAPVSSSAAPEVSLSSTAVPLVSSSEAPAVAVSSEAPAVVVASSSPSSNVASSSTAPVAA